MLEYKSADGYFIINEIPVKDTIEVITLFSTPIFGIEDFYTKRVFNTSGKLISYENASGDFIDYSKNPITVLTPPRLLG